ncbi:polysaccharide deacetylase family protein [Patulibacter defluvii]|uniref:polysaccharide deacetylase family protein n=1 Tax=Patulibacter defluvii TaxID=3095358 RepID=UPI002A756D4D|nr:polysaccharide deacetylase family protein [Patulibacter sp. DM4]
MARPGSRRAVAALLVGALGLAGSGCGGDRPSPPRSARHEDWAARHLAPAPPPALTGRARPTLAPTRSNGLTCVAKGPVRLRHGPRDRRRRVALTFDDGPSPYTAPILRTLERRRARATFFQLGRQIGPYQHLVRQLVRRGHALGNHSWSHPSLAPADARTRDQLDWTALAQRRAVGHAGCLMRPPGGDIGGRLERLLRRRGQLAVLWDVDPDDWGRPGTRTIVERVLRTVRPGSIVLLHDGGGDRSQTVAAVPWIVKGLRKRGYHLVTVPTLLGLRRR